MCCVTWFQKLSQAFLSRAWQRQEHSFLPPSLHHLSEIHFPACSLQGLSFTSLSRMINQHSGSLRCPVPTASWCFPPLAFDSRAAGVQPCSPSHGLIPRCPALSGGFPKPLVARRVNAAGLWGAANHAVLEDGGLLCLPKLVGSRNVPSSLGLPLHGEAWRDRRPVPAPAAHSFLPQNRALQSRVLNSNRCVLQRRGALPPSPAEASGSRGLPAAAGAGTGGAVG